MKSRKPKQPLVQSAEPAEYIMPAPNNDIDEYGWHLKNFRWPDSKSVNPKDPDPGKPLFITPRQTIETLRKFGHDARFMCPTYLQIILDGSKEIRKAAENATKSRYTKESLAKLEATINRVVRDVVLPDIINNYKAIAPFIAQFYAARVAALKLKKAQKQKPTPKKSKRAT